MMTWAVADDGYCSPPSYLAILHVRWSAPVMMMTEAGRSVSWAAAGGGEVVLIFSRKVAHSD